MPRPRAIEIKCVRFELERSALRQLAADAKKAGRPVSQYLFDHVRDWIKKPTNLPRVGRPRDVASIHLEFPTELLRELDAYADLAGETRAAILRGIVRVAVGVDPVLN